MKRTRRHTAGLVLLVCAGLIGCGGGGGGGGAAGAGAGGGGANGAPTAPPTVIAEVTNYAPLAVVPSDTVVFAGSGLLSVTSVKFGDVAAAFVAHSDTQLSATVPAGVAASTASVTLAGSGFSIEEPIAVSAQTPTITSLSSAVVPEGSAVTVTGSMLDAVTSFSVNGVSLAVSSLTPTGAVLTTPAATVLAGPIAVTDAAGAVWTTAYTLSTYEVLTVTSMSAVDVISGAGVTATGTGLGSVTSVSFDNAANAVITSQTDTSLTFTVTPQAQSNTGGLQPYVTHVTFAGPLQSFTTRSTLNVGPALTVAATTGALASSGATMNVSVTGSNLELVTSATVGGVPATIVSAASSLLTLSVPGVSVGAVLLNTPYQTNVPAGTLSVSSLSSGTAALSELAFSEVFNKAGSDTTLRLTPARPVLARAFVQGSVEGIPNAGVTLKVSNGTTTFGSLPMAGPTTLPTSASQDVLATTYNVTVPAAWITPGVTFKAVVAATGSSASMTVTSTPRVGNAAKLHVVLVPLDLGVGGVALLPTTSAAHDAFARAYPIANASVTVTARAPFAVSGVSSIATTANMASLLTQLEALRQQEDPTAIYYGMFPTGADISNYSGLGYIGTPGAESASPASAVGYDAAWQFSSVDPFNLGLQAWTQTMLHEVGHIHSLMHAPCGNPASPDPNYPYAGGILNPNFAMYDSLYASDTAVGLIASTTPSGAGGGSMTDVMGYCSGEFFSDYSYSKVQAFAEARTIAFASPDTVTTAASGLARTGAFQRQETTSAARASHAGYIVISGLLDSSGVTLQPAQATSQDSVGTVPAQSPYALRVTSTAGQVFVYPLQVNEIADAAETTYSFALAVPNPGAVAHVEVLHDGVVVTNSPATQAAIAEEVHRASTTGPARTRGASAAWSEEGGVLRLTWNAAVEPFASVIQVSAAGVRSVVAMRLRGGSAVLPTVALPAGGTLELGFSSTTTARLVTAAR